MNTRINVWLSGVLALAALSGGCAETVLDAPVDEAKPEETVTQGGGKEDAWNYTNDPARFGGQFVTRLLDLPRSGRSARSVWPSTYWPTYENAINVRWQGRTEYSPAERYDRAFNGWTPSAEFAALRPFNPSDCSASSWDRAYYDQLGPLARYVSQNMGNRGARDGVDSDRDGQIDECDDHDGVATWFGLCHAWVPASILEERAERPVTYNGVTFQPSDLDALLIAAYNSSPASMIGGRCNLGTGGPSDTQPVERDEFGRAILDECRDANAGSLHVIMTNRLGIQQRPFAVDKTYDYQVWNQPVVAFEVSRLEEITLARANQLLGVSGDAYRFNANAVKFYDVSANYTYLTESNASTTPVDPTHYERREYLTYILEVDATGAIIGGEYHGNSRSSHPDFLWDPSRLTRSSTPNLDLDNVRMLIRMSREPVAPTGNVRAFAGAGNLTIPDNNTTGVSSVANVGETLTVAGLQVELDLTHTYVGDLRIVLSHNGIERVIHNNEGGGTDNIQRSISVTGFEGVAANGTWTLRVVDNAAQDTGTLRSWRLLVSPGSTGGGTSTGSVATVAGRGGIDIPDNNQTGITAAARFDRDLTIGRLQIDLDVTHTYIGDLLITLSHGGITRTVHGNAGADADNIRATIDVSGFENAQARGDWTLTVKDTAGSDVGRLNSWTLRFIAGSGTGGTTTPTGETFPGEGGGRAIPDNNRTGLSAVAGVPSTITSGRVSVAVNISHTYQGDLVVTVSHRESGYSRTLHNATGGGTDNLVQTFALSDFTRSPAGTWTLTVVDKAAQDLGTLNSWSVSVQP